jgi:hypothetical protein
MNSTQPLFLQYVYYPADMHLAVRPERTPFYKVFTSLGNLRAPIACTVWKYLGSKVRKCA